MLSKKSLWEQGGLIGYQLSITYMFSYCSRYTIFGADSSNGVAVIKAIFLIHSPLYNICSDALKVSLYIIVDVSESICQTRSKKKSVVVLWNELEVLLMQVAVDYCK